MGVDLDDLTSVAKLCHNLHIGKSSQVLVVPRVDGDLMALHILRLNNLWQPISARADDKEGRVQVLLIKVVEQLEKRYKDESSL
jgi:hypothetical protein